MKYFPVNEFTKPKLVIGEGHDEWSFFNAVINHLQLGDQLATEQYGGRYKLADGLRAIEERPGFRKNITSLAVTRDADFLDDPQASSEAVIQAAFQSVCGGLQKSGLPVPSQPFVVEDAIYRGADFRVGVFIFPGPNQTGMLEDLSLSAITTDPVNLCLDGLWQCLESQLPDGRRSHTREAAPKARIHAWLATRPIPDLRLGEAALNGDVDFNHAAFDGLNQFLNAL